MNNVVNEPKAQAPRVETAYRLPEVDITETKDEYVLVADMPGVGKGGLEVLLDNNELTIVGRRQLPPSGAEVLHRESKAHDFRRTFEVDPVIETTRIRAQIVQGVLTVHLPKAERVKPRRVLVGD
jgi:HSP20 family molecular chaperone IbpA